MKRYSISGDQALGSDQSILGLVSASTIRPEIYDIIVGCGIAPGDTASKLLLQRFTVAGTATAFTPVSLDPADPAALSSAGSNHTVEPTYTSALIVLTISLNQRATFRWVASPGFEFRAPATAANGFGLKSSTSPGTAVHDATFLYQE